MVPFKIADFVPVMTKESRYARYEIGDYTYGHPLIQEYSGGVHLKIGKFCSIADGVIFMLGGEHRYELGSTYPFQAFFPLAQKEPTHIRIKGDIVVGNDVWIGRDAMILSGVKIGDGAVIGARAVVTRDVEPYAIVVGSPAKHIKYRLFRGAINALLKIRWWDWPLEQIAEALPLLLQQDLGPFIAKYLESA